MSVGGKRPGSGRPKGSRNVKTIAQVEKVAASGLLPLDNVLTDLRDETADRDVRMDAANKAAPYCHAKLATVDHKSTDGSMSPPSRIVLEAERDGSAA